MSLREEERYVRKNSFFKERLDTCAYRFYEMIQIRAKEVPRLLNNDEDFALKQQVRETVLGSSDRFINCLRGEHHSQDIPEYLFPAAESFKQHYFTRLAPQFVLEEERLKVLETVFSDMDPN